MYRMLIPEESFMELNLPLPPGQIRELEKRIKKGNAVEPVPAWHNYILTGYERYSLCEKYHRHYQVSDMYFQRKHEAIAWICRQQLKRADLHKQATYWLISRLYTALFKEEERKTAPDRFQYKKLSPSIRSEIDAIRNPENTALMKTVGKEFGYHWATIRNYVRYGKYTDQLEEMFPGIRIRILKGEIEIPIMFAEALMQMPKEELAAMVHDPGCRKLLPPEDVQIKIRTNRETFSKRKEKIHVDTAIKEMPAYDPDAELNQLTYTVGTWSKTVNRTTENANFRVATEKGKENLYRALSALAADMKNLTDKLEAESHERIREPDGTPAQLHSGRPFRSDPDPEPGIQPGLPAGPVREPYHQNDP